MKKVVNELVILIQSLIGIPVPAQSTTTTIIDGTITTITEVSNGYDLQYIFMAFLISIFFVGLFKIIIVFMGKFGGKI